MAAAWLTSFLAPTPARLPRSGGNTCPVVGLPERAGLLRASYGRDDASVAIEGNDVGRGKPARRTTRNGSWCDGHLRDTSSRQGSEGARFSMGLPSARLIAEFNNHLQYS